MALQFNLPVDRVEGITREVFEKEYFFPQKPVVIRGLLGETEAMKKWSFDFFKEEMGDLEVGIFDASLERVDRSFKKPDYMMPFRDYLSEIEQGPTKKRLFLFNAFKFNKRLLDDFEFPKICKGFIKSLPFMFFGGDESVTRIHQDMDMSCVFLTQFTGKKRVILFSPDYSDLLYRLPYNVHTTVDIRKPDYEKFPGLQHVQGHEVILEHGDTLFMPSGYWHHIEYMGSGFSMSMRCLSPNKKDWVQGGLNVALRTHFDELMLKLMDDKWFNYKVNRASDRADKTLKSLAS